jgi:tRNA(Arg) A34 adenosine deaminase TadA
MVLEQFCPLCYHSSLQYAALCMNGWSDEAATRHRSGQPTAALGRGPRLHAERRATPARPSVASTSIGQLKEKRPPEVGTEAVIDDCVAFCMTWRCMLVVGHTLGRDTMPDDAVEMTSDRLISYLRAADAVAREAIVHGHHPFGAVLVGPDGRILMSQANINTVRHAETELARRAAEAYQPEFLWSCTLVSTGEPCAMCTGTLYWANIGRLVYGFEEVDLLALTGDDPANPTLNLASRTVLASGQKEIEVLGPFPELAHELLAAHRDFWKPTPRD